MQATLAVVDEIGVEQVVWVGDNRDGINGGGDYVRWVRSLDQARDAAAFFATALRPGAGRGRSSTACRAASTGSSCPTESWSSGRSELDHCVTRRGSSCTADSAPPGRRGRDDAAAMRDLLGGSVTTCRRRTATAERSASTAC